MPTAVCRSIDQNTRQTASALTHQPLSEKCDHQQRSERCGHALIRPFSKRRCLFLTIQQQLSNRRRRCCELVPATMASHPDRRLSPQPFRPDPATLKSPLQDEGPGRSQRMQSQPERQHKQNGSSDSSSTTTCLVGQHHVPGCGWRCSTRHLTKCRPFPAGKSTVSRQGIASSEARPDQTVSRDP